MYNEELGAVIQVHHYDTDEVMKELKDAGLGRHSHIIGTLNDSDRIEFTYNQQRILSEKRVFFQRAWSSTTFQMQSLRDNPDCAREALDRIAEDVKKCLQSAIANAENNHNLDVDELIVAEAWVGKNLVMKRGRPRARGRFGRIHKPFSELTIKVRQIEETA